MTHHTDAERAEFEAWLGIKPCGAAHDLAWSAWKAARRAPAAPVPQCEPVGSVYTMEALVPGGREVHHVSLYMPLPAGTKLYAAPQPPDTATSEHSKPMCGAAPKVDPIAWYVTGCSTMLDEHDAKAEAKRCGGCAQAVPLYTEQQVRELLAAHGIT